MVLCEKTVFADQKTAQEHLVRIFFEKKRRRVSPNREYLCPNCGAWHLSSNGKNDYVYNLKINQLREEINELKTKKKPVKVQSDDTSIEELLEKNAKLTRKLESAEKTIVKVNNRILKLNLKMSEHKERFELLRSHRYITDRFFALLSTEKDLEVLEGLKKYIENKINEINEL